MGYQYDLLGDQHGGNMLKPRNGGYSMVEVLVTIAVLAVLLAAVTPSAAGLIANLRLRGAAEAVMTGLQKARSEAIKSNQIVTFWLVSASTTAALDKTCALSATSSSWVVSYDNPAGFCDSDPSTTTMPRIVQINNTGPSSSNLVVSALDADGNASTQASFNGFGRKPDAATRLDISTIDFSSNTSGTKRLRVQVSLIGGVRMCDPDVTATADPRYCTP
jgi:type IV fimbrial biogenesis protein FimT